MNRLRMVLHSASYPSAWGLGLVLLKAALRSRSLAQMLTPGGRKVGGLKGIAGRPMALGGRLIGYLSGVGHFTSPSLC
jgi:hypothetical protein